jgi:type II secretory ATPase GspE/PulE/Tfp pilus assembly ATPase PilB-like protein
MNPIELLANTAIFSSLNEKTLEKIASRLVRVEYPIGQNLMEKGQSADVLFVIESGLVGVFAQDSDFGHGVEIAQLGPNECIGELALITGERRSATCTALVNTVAHKLDRQVFEAILTQSPKVQLELIRVLSKRLGSVGSTLGVPFVSLSKYDPDPILAEMVPEKLIYQHAVVPVAFEDGAIILAAVDPSNRLAIREVRQFLKAIVTRIVAVSREDFDRFMARLQLKAPVTGKDVPRKSMARQSRLPDIRYLTEIEEADRSSSVSGPEVLEIVNRIITTGIEEGASDIHVEPTRDGTNVRYRIHGSLETRFDPIRAEAHKSLMSRIKVLARMDITETRKPQEGRISVEMGKRAVDLRLSFIPTKLGQKLVIRILDASMALAPLEELILAEGPREMIRNMFYAPHGVVLVTGPTGSGKTTTMYSALLERRKPEINMVTVEDPIEFHLDGLSQVEVGGNTGIDYASVLRSFLRQDPDIILVGETRDAETAKLSLQAGLTGRLVFTSYHTNSCVSALVRLFEMGMEPFALGNAIVGVIHQRLIRRLCPYCRAPYEYHPQVIANLQSSGVIGSKPPTLYKAKGCVRCRGQGYIGRVSAVEVLAINEKMRGAISDQQSPEQILSHATKETFVTLPAYMNYLLRSGHTVPGEVLGALPRKSS